MITVREAVTRRDIREFVLFPWRVYKNDPNWVPPIIMDMFRMLNRRRSPFFEFGEAAYFLAYRDGRCAGRISAHVNRHHNDFHGTKDGFFGFYECLDDDEASRALLSAAETWVFAKGMTRIIGPESFTVYDEQCLLVDGWEADPSTPVVMEVYNPRYYIDHMTKSGYGKEIDWYAFKVDGSAPIRDGLLKAKERLVNQKGYVFRHVNFKRLDEEIAKIKVIFNEAWADNWGHYPFTDRQFDQIKEALLLFVDPRLCFIVETKEGAPVGCSITLPDINPAVKRMNGRFFPFGWFHFLYGRKHSEGARTFMMGVMKEYRNQGVDIAMVVETIRTGLAAGYKWSECSLVVETNLNMIRPIEKWGGTRYKSYRLFSKQLTPGDIKQR